MLTRVAVDGHGIAACCCAALLRKHGFEVSFTRFQVSSGPTLLVNPSTQSLLADVFETPDGLFSDLPIVRQRVVLWGSEATPVVLPHSGAVVNEAELLAKLWRKVEALPPSFSGPADWSIHSAPQLTSGAQQQFGSRVANAVPVELKKAGSDACWIESLDTGWLFLIPCGDRRGSLIAVGGSPDVLLHQSRLVAQQIECATGSGAVFPAYPRVLESLCAPGWLACGSAAMSFDPICGEGAGNAVREAILASAVIGSLASHSNMSGVLAHYSSRLFMGFLRHLNLCRQFYASARRGDWWDSELAELDRGIEWTRLQLSGLPKPQYRLVDFNLEQLSGNYLGGGGRRNAALGRTLKSVSNAE